ncbi:MAG: thioredoxin domain-containing protein, partial [Ignavibacteriae bacterium]|nr:thioredoxin domain-containing protein [Ignavibacteriota bacterium]
MNDSTKTHEHTNRLINEKSPYLLQHAHNPVNWFPWGEEAFEKARKENKPIFLSVGYSTCHWCHVMEHESFDDEEVANLMNKHFVSIKVDREERPDIDNIYMSVCQMMTGSGGWPLTVVLRPDKKPFFAGTYFPKHSRQGRIGMLDLVAQLANGWKTKRTEIDKSAEEITQYLNVQSAPNISGKLSEDILDKAFNIFNKRFDQQYGGFGNGRKFPSPHNLLFLLRYWNKSGNETALNMVTKTLTEMRKGGIFDHVGFGFHRYSTESNWFLPHFEKMLYDQAMLLLAYTEAYQATKNELFKQTAEEIIEYITRDMTSPEGGFYSAEDADSEGKEGKFYVWNKKEVLDILGKEDGEWFSNIYNLTDKGTYHEESSGKATGQNIPFLSQTFDDLVNNLQLSKSEVQNKFHTVRAKLFDVRKKRIHPYKDDKILTDWNGLMIAALAKAGKSFDQPKYIALAEKSVGFIFSKLVDGDGKLLHRFRDKEAGIKAQIDDYSFLIWGLLELYESTFEINHLEKAIDLTEVLLADLWDKKNNSGFYFMGEGGEELIARPKEFYDGAIPSGNSVMYSNLLRLE